MTRDAHRRFSRLYLKEYTDIAACSTHYNQCINATALPLLHKNRRIHLDFRSHCRSNRHTLQILTFCSGRLRLYYSINKRFKVFFKLTCSERRFAYHSVYDVLQVAGLPEGAQLRLAAMDVYDGTTFTMSPAGTHPGDGYLSVGTRMPAFDVPDGSAAAQMTISSSGLLGPWVPATGAVTALTFTGGGAAAQQDGLHLDRWAQAYSDRKSVV